MEGTHRNMRFLIVVDVGRVITGLALLELIVR
jgi:hypothetical protein